MLKKSDFVEIEAPSGVAGGAASPSGEGRLERHGDQLCELAQVLGGGGEEEFVFCAVRTSEAQPIGTDI